MITYYDKIIIWFLLKNYLFITSHVGKANFVFKIISLSVSDSLTEKFVLFWFLIRNIKLKIIPTMIPMRKS